MCSSDTSFFHSSPAAGSICKPIAHMHKPSGLSTSLCPGVHLCISVQGWCLPGVRDNDKDWVLEGLTVCTGHLLTTAAGKGTGSNDSSQKAWYGQLLIFERKSRKATWITTASIPLVSLISTVWSTDLHPLRACYMDYITSMLTQETQQVTDLKCLPVT